MAGEDFQGAKRVKMIQIKDLPKRLQAGQRIYEEVYEEVEVGVSRRLRKMPGGPMFQR
jgi:hypothetical protein